MGLADAKNQHAARRDLMQMLASAASLEEAILLSELAVDILDLKNPLEGALGALSDDLVAKIVEACPFMTISATIGDLPMVGSVIASRVEAMAMAGVVYVKIGFFPSPHWQEVLWSLRPLAAKGVRLVAVFFADHPLDLGMLSKFREAGLVGVMLDTADKKQGGLLDYRDLPWILEFLETAKSLGFMTGLAGSLRALDIQRLRPLEPDYLGFRGALCFGDRTGLIDPEAVQRIRERLTYAGGES